MKLRESDKMTSEEIQIDQVRTLHSLMIVGRCRREGRLQVMTLLLRGLKNWFLLEDGGVIW